MLWSFWAVWLQCRARFLQARVLSPPNGSLVPRQTLRRVGFLFLHSSQYRTRLVVHDPPPLRQVSRQRFSSLACPARRRLFFLLDG